MFGVDTYGKGGVECACLLRYNPDEQEIVANWLQESIVPDPQHQQIEFVLSGLYAQLEKSITTKKV